MEMRSRARRVVREHNSPLGMIVVDYLQLMQIKGTWKTGSMKSPKSRAL